VSGADGPSDEARAERRVAVCFGLSVVAGLGLTLVYVLGGQPQAEGGLLFLALGFLGLGLVLWGKELLPNDPVTAPRGSHESSSGDREGVEEAFTRDQDGIFRRTFLLKMLLLAGGSLGVAALFPIASLGPTPGRALKHTSWAKGKRLVQENGTPVRPSDVGVDNILTVFPEGTGDDPQIQSDSQVVLINLGSAKQAVRKGRATWAVGGLVAYSKICTHAGCPVGLYQAQGSARSAHHLLCPCHQSTFDVLDGCRPVFGPAARSLPQLPLALDDQGYLVAQSDFTEPVGPSYWNRT
jgi:ubiquinol-cytochrome c reductase iron-sulfur subunit